MFIFSLFFFLFVLLCRKFLELKLFVKQVAGEKDRNFYLQQYRKRAGLQSVFARDFRSFPPRDLTEVNLTNGALPPP